MKKQIILGFFLITLFSVNAQSSRQLIFNNMNVIIKGVEGKKVDYSLFDKDIRKVKSQIFSNDNFINKEIQVGENKEHIEKYSKIDWNNYIEYKIIQGVPSKDLCSFKIYFNSSIIHEYGAGVNQIESIDFVIFYCLKKDKEKIEKELNSLKQLVP